MSMYAPDPGLGPLFDPPSGPAAEVYTEEDGRPAAFVSFLESEEGAAFWRELQDAALDAHRTGESRFSPRDFLAHYRATRKVRLNNVWSPWLADMLVAEYPALGELIERRKRTKAGPFDGGAS